MSSQKPGHRYIRVALLVEYNGTEFSGSQFQSHHGKELPTVQKALQDALNRLNLDVPSVVMAGRTDAGVHAHGQVAHFDVLAENLAKIPGSPEPLLARSMNAVLPANVSVKQAALDVSPDFHSRKSASHRWYRYTIYNAPERSCWTPEDAAFEGQVLDEAAMNRAAACLLGTHNFLSFRCLQATTAEEVCQIYHSRVHREENSLYFDIVADRFLYKMVRNLTGLLLVVGRSRDPLPPEIMAEALDRRDAIFVQQLASTARPEGLSLKAVNYPEPLNYFSQDIYVRTLNQLIITESMQDENLYRKAS